MLCITQQLIEHRNSKSIDKQALSEYNEFVPSIKSVLDVKRLFLGGLLEWLESG
jgi:hypothetical protein